MESASRWGGHRNLAWSAGSPPNIADLLQHGLLKASFIPSAPQRELRELTRYRVRLTEERAKDVNRVQKTLEDTNLKLGDVVSDIMGKASPTLLHAIAMEKLCMGKQNV